MILVDTSVLVGFLTGRDTPGTRYLERLVREEAAFCLTPLVIQEVLQGARDERTWLRLKEYRTLDCLVAQVALDHGLSLLHEDRDYDAIRRVRPLTTLP